jgi:hypothetical protein
VWFNLDLFASYEAKISADEEAGFRDQLFSAIILVAEAPAESAIQALFMPGAVNEFVEEGAIIMRRIYKPRPVRHVIRVRVPAIERATLKLVF